MFHTVYLFVKYERSHGIAVSVREFEARDLCQIPNQKKNLNLKQTSINLIANINDSWIVSVISFFFFCDFIYKFDATNIPWCLIKTKIISLNVLLIDF